MLTILNQLSYFWIIFILALLVTLVSTLTYKFVTDQKKLKRVKEDIKKLREKQKKHVDNQKKFMEIQKEMMSKNTDLMKESFKPMIYTLIPLLLVFGWMAANLVFEPIQPGQSFQVNIELRQPENVSLQLPEQIQEVSRNNTSWTLRASQEGTYELIFVGDTFTESKEILITTQKKYINPVSTHQNNLRRIEVVHKEVKPFGETKFFNWRPGWLGTYVLLSIVLSIILRKLLRVA